MRVLVTGAAGFIGSHLCDRLLADGHKVQGVDNLTTGREENIPRGDTKGWNGLCVADVDKIRLLPLPTADLIVHCAASYDDRDNWKRDLATNAQGTAAVADAAAAWGCPVVYFQTALIYGNNPYDDLAVRMLNRVAMDADVDAWPLLLNTPAAPDSSYAISKYAAEQYLRLSGVPLLTFRLANIYGPRNLSGPIPTFYKRVSEGQACTIADTRRDFVYIDDLCNLVIQAIGKEATGTYHVSTGRDYPIGQVYDAVVGALDAYDTPSPENVARGQDDAARILLDPTDTIRDFGWQATTDLDEGVEEAVAWYREHGVEQTYTHLAATG